MVRPAGAGLHPEGEAPAVALVQIREPAAVLAGGHCEALRRHLSLAGKVIELDAARALVHSDNLRRTGLAYRRPGEDWFAHVAEDNRLWTPSRDPRPITAFEGDVAALRRDLDEALASPEPVVVTHAGALSRNGELMQFRSTVVRIGGRSKCGAGFVLTDFVRRVA